MQLSLIRQLQSNTITKSNNPHENKNGLAVLCWGMLWAVPGRIIRRWKQSERKSFILKTFSNKHSKLRPSSIKCKDFFESYRLPHPPFWILSSLILATWIQLDGKLLSTKSAGKNSDYYLSIRSNLRNLILLSVYAHTHDLTTFFQHANTPQNRPLEQICATIRKCMNNFCSLTYAMILRTAYINCDIVQDKKGQTLSSKHLSWSLRTTHKCTKLQNKP